jgi:hypothetical protein
LPTDFILDNKTLRGPAFGTTDFSVSSVMSIKLSSVISSSAELQNKDENIITPSLINYKCSNVYTPKHGTTQLLFRHIKSRATTNTGSGQVQTGLKDGQIPENNTAGVSLP